MNDVIVGVDTSDVLIDCRRQVTPVFEFCCFVWTLWRVEVSDQMDQSFQVILVVQNGLGGGVISLRMIDSEVLELTSDLWLLSY